jgi:transcriptional regulator with XRE-family HTH domain
MKLLIKLIRKKRRMTLNELSDLTGISKSYLSQIEHNYPNLTLGKLETIAAALEICPRELIKCDRKVECSNCSHCMLHMKGE